MNFVVESDRLHIRQFSLSDVEKYYQMTRDPLIQHYIPFACESTIKETYEAFEMCYSVNTPYDFYLILEEKNSHEIIGAIISTAIKTYPLTLDVCILTAAEHRQKGYMFEALIAFKNALPKSTELLFSIKKENVASLKTITKLPGIVEKTISRKPGGFLLFSLLT